MESSVRNGAQEARLGRAVASASGESPDVSQNTLGSAVCGGSQGGVVMRECWVIEEQNDNGEWYIIHLFGGRGAADEELARWPSTPENPKRVVRYVPDTTAPPQEEP